MALNDNDYRRLDRLARSITLGPPPAGVVVLDNHLAAFLVDKLAKSPNPIAAGKAVYIAFRWWLDPTDTGLNPNDATVCGQIQAGVAHLLGLKDARAPTTGVPTGAQYCAIYAAAKALFSALYDNERAWLDELIDGALSDEDCGRRLFGKLREDLLPVYTCPSSDMENPMLEGIRRRAKAKVATNSGGAFLKVWGNTITFLDGLQKLLFVVLAVVMLVYFLAGTRVLDFLGSGQGGAQPAGETQLPADQQRMLRQGRVPQLQGP